MTGVLLGVVSAIDNWIGLGIAAALAVYLIVVLVVPERF